MVEHDLAKVGVAGSSPVFRSAEKSWCFKHQDFFISGYSVLKNCLFSETLLEIKSPQEYLGAFANIVDRLFIFRVVQCIIRYYNLRFTGIAVFEQVVTAS